MQIHMPKRKIISLILKYLIIYWCFCVVSTLIYANVIVNHIEEEVNMSLPELFQSTVSSAQQYVVKNQVSFDDKQKMPFLYQMTALNTYFSSSGEILGAPVRAYCMLWDREAGKIITDSVSNEYLILRCQSKEKVSELLGMELEEAGAQFYCPLEIFEEAYANARKNQESISAGALGDVIRNNATWGELLNPGNGLLIQPVDAWYRVADGTFLPDKVLITWKDERNGDSVILDFSPATTEGYVYAGNLEHTNVPVSENGISGNYRFASLIMSAPLPTESFLAKAREQLERRVSGRSESFSDASTEKEIGMTEKITYEMAGTILDVNGKSYTYASYVCVEDFWRNVMTDFYKIWFVVCEFVFVGFVIGWCFAYNKMKYKYESESYRKMLVNVMAHDLKTPLTAMEGYAESLKEGVNTDKREIYAEEIERNVKYVNEIISENLAVSQYEFEKKRIERKPVELTELCRESIRRYQSKADEKKLRFVTEGETKVRGDAELLQRAFDNLILNAVKYSVPESEIKILGENHRIRIQNVADQKPEGKLKKLWQPFVRGSESRSGEKGTGLGLYVVAKILNDHKWKYKLRYDEKSQTFECEIRIPVGILF